MLWFHAKPLFPFLPAPAVACSLVLMLWFHAEPLFPFSARSLRAPLQDLVKRITQCAEKFAPSNSWYVGVITKVFRLAGDMVKPEVAHNLMQVRACLCRGGCRRPTARRNMRFEQMACMLLRTPPFECV